MRKFIIVITFYLIIPALVFGITFELLLRHIPNRYVYKKEYLDNLADSVQVLILGASHAYYGINPAYLKLRSFNCANPSQSLDIDYEILKKYGPSLTHLKWIIQPIIYPSLTMRVGNSIESWRVFNYVNYFDLDVPHKITDYSFILSNTNFRFNVNILLDHYVLKNYNPTCSVLGWGEDFRNQPPEDLMAGKSQVMKETIANSSINYNLPILDSIINYARQRNTKVLFFLPPSYHTYVECLDTVQLNNTINAVATRTRQDSNLVFINMLTDSYFTKEDFHDVIHLNEFGAKKLSLRIDSIINGIDNKKN